MIAAIERFATAGMLRFRLRSRAAMARTMRLTGAAVAAFVVALAVFPDTVPILAPLTALLVVEVTLKDILTSGLQRVASVTAGVLLAVGFSSIVGLTWWSLGVLVAVAILVGQLLRLGPHLIEVPISAMLVLAVGGAEAAATDRIAETLLGAAVGVAVNLVFPPAVRASTAAEAVHRYASELAKLLDAAATDLRDPITQAQATRWMEDARALSRHVPAIDKALAHAEDSRRLNPRALVVADTNSSLRSDLDALEHTNVAVRSMFRSILDGVRDDPTPDPTKGEDLRLVFSTLLGDVAAAVQAFGDLALAEGTDHVGDTEDALKVALDTLREARDRIDDLQLIDAGTDGGWELSEPVRQTVERVLRDLDLSGQSRRNVVPTVSPKVDPLEIIKSAHHLLHPPRPPRPGAGKAGTAARRAPGRREIPADQTGPHRLPIGRATAGRSARTPRGDSAVETGRLRIAGHPGSRPRPGPPARRPS
jgi:hypothetical protein